MKKSEIRIVPENCTGCLRCQLACSELYTKSFNPHEARIQVVMSGDGCTIRFKEDCTFCGVCADHCLYDALLKIPREAAQ